MEIGEIFSGFASHFRKILESEGIAFQDYSGTISVSGKFVIGVDKPIENFLISKKIIIPYLDEHGYVPEKFEKEEEFPTVFCRKDGGECVIMVFLDNASHLPGHEKVIYLTFRVYNFGRRL